MPKTDIFTLLEKDHKEAKSLLKKIIQQCEQDDEVDFAQVEEVRDALELHTKIALPGSRPISIWRLRVRTIPAV